MSQDKKTDESPDSAAPKRGLKALILPVVLAVGLGGGAFYSVSAGLVVFPALEKSDSDQKTSEDPEKKISEAALPSFVAFDPLIISLGETSRSRHLKLLVQAETAPDREEDVSALTPRILDVLNTYLRAVDERDLESPRAMSRLRAQMLRRVQMVTPEGSVRDLLILEFVLN